MITSIILLFLLVLAMFVIVIQRIEIKFLKKSLHASGVLTGRDAEIFMQHMEEASEKKKTPENLKRAAENYKSMKEILEKSKKNKLK